MKRLLRLQGMLQKCGNGQMTFVSILKFAFILFSNSSTFSDMKQAISPASVLEFWQHHLPPAWLSVIERAKQLILILLCLLTIIQKRPSELAVMVD